MRYQNITSDPHILNGKPIIIGSRISVEIILEWIATGATIDAIYKENKQLPKGSVEEAIMYAAQFTKNEILLEDEISS
ncbi:MAG: DUF433 domain-containing protein [Ginsengibacter sp.]